MPYAAWVATNGLKACVMVVSGELSMTSLVALVVEPDVLPLGLDEHAASPPQTTATADRPTRPRLLSRLLMLPPTFLVDRRSDVSSAEPVLLIPPSHLAFSSGRDGRGSGAKVPARGGAVRGDRLGRRVLRAALVVRERAP